MKCIQKHDYLLGKPIEKVKVYLQLGIFAAKRTQVLQDAENETFYCTKPKGIICNFLISILSILRITGSKEAH